MSTSKSIPYLGISDGREKYIRLLGKLCNRENLCFIKRVIVGFRSTAGSWILFPGHFFLFFFFCVCIGYFWSKDSRRKISNDSLMKIRVLIGYYKHMYKDKKLFLFICVYVCLSSSQSGLWHSQLGPWNTPTAPLQKDKTPATSVLDMTQSDGEAPVMLERWGMRSTPLLPSLPSLLWSWMVALYSSYLWVK